MKRLSEVIGIERMKALPNPTQFINTGELVAEGFNDCVDILDGFVMDEEKLSQLIPIQPLENDTRLTIAKHIIANADKWIVRKA